MEKIRDIVGRERYYHRLKMYLINALNIFNCEEYFKAICYAYLKLPILKDTGNDLLIR